MNTDNLTDEVLGRAHESNGKLKLDCAEAFALAREFKVQPSTVGEVCNENNVRICKCQLGCFH